MRDGVGRRDALLWTWRRPRLQAPGETLLGFQGRCCTRVSVDCDTTVASFRGGKGEERMEGVWQRNVTANCCATALYF